MSHPYQQHREHHVERDRVHHITGSHEPTRTYEHIKRARGGKVEHSDEAEDKALVKGLVKPSALKHDGHKAKHRADKAHRAKGGRVKKNKATIVNVNVAPQQPQSQPHPVPVPVPQAGAAPPPVPPRPPMMPPGGGPPGMPPPGIRATGGRIGFKTGGPVNAPTHGGMAPHLPSGSGGGKARMAKERMAAKHYHKAPAGVSTS